MRSKALEKAKQQAAKSTYRLKSVNVKEQISSAWFIIPLVIYPFDILCSFGQSDPELIKVLDKLGTDHADAPWKLESDTIRGRTCVFNGGQTLLRLPGIPRIPEEFGTLAHEVFHAVDFLMRRINVKLTEDSDETYAYLTGYITEQIFIKLNNSANILTSV